MYNYNDAEIRGFKITEPYLEAGISCLKRKDLNREIRSIASIRNTYIGVTFIPMYYSGIDVVYYETMDATVNAVVTGAQDAAFIYSRCAEYAINNDITNRLVSERVYSNETGFCIGIKENQDPLLSSILNKAAASIDEADVYLAMQKYMQYDEKETSLLEYLYSDPVGAILISAVFFALMLFTILLVLARKRRVTDKARIAEEVKRSNVLRQAVEAAGQAAAAREMFMSRVSHEMRTPLNAIIGFLTLAEKSTKYNERNEYIIKCQAAAKQLLLTINEVLEASALENGNLDLAETPFMLKETVYSITQMFSDQAKMKGIMFDTIPVDIENEYLIGDANRLNHILSNLLSNAIKFTPAGGRIKLVVTQLTSKNDSGYYRFEVIDTGIGMDSEFLKRIWKPFEQEDSSIGIRYGGTGLGTSIVKMLVSVMKGTVSATSEKGKGSAFTVDLSFKIDYEAQDNAPRKTFGELRALVVDTERYVCDYGRLLLSKYDVESTAVLSGEDALREIAYAEKEGKPYSLCFISQKLERIGGIEVSRIIKKTYGDKIKTVLLVDNSHVSMEKTASSAGISAVVTKPLFPSTVYNLLSNLFGRTNSGRKLPVQNKIYFFANKKVLLAEDNEMNMLVAMKMLEKAGFTVQRAKNGYEALNMYINEKAGYFDAILMDVQMPGMNGYEASRAIRASDKEDAKTIPIIAMTANSFKEDIAASLAAGMNEHISKPIDYIALFETLDNYVNKKTEKQGQKK